MLLLFAGPANMCHSNARVGLRVSKVHAFEALLKTRWTQR